MIKCSIYVTWLVFLMCVCENCSEGQGAQNAKPYEIRNSHALLNYTFLMDSLILAPVRQCDSAVSAASTKTTAKYLQFNMGTDR